ncbi:MAG: hypothetical protein WB539_09600 [Planktothrix agardhii]|uniref:hypothetical protein n=1 Tax=Planktothrix agardhii TaxID=1160 RepID=UPI003C5180D4
MNFGLILRWVSIKSISLPDKSLTRPPNSAAAISHWAISGVRYSKNNFKVSTKICGFVIS